MMSKYIYLRMYVISSIMINHNFICLCNRKLALTASHFCGVTMVTLISAACDVVSACNFELTSFPQMNACDFVKSSDVMGAKAPRQVDK